MAAAHSRSHADDLLTENVQLSMFLSWAPRWWFFLVTSLFRLLNGSRRAALGHQLVVFVLSPKWWCWSAFFFFFALYLLSLHLKVTAHARVPLYAGEVVIMTQVRPQETSVCVKMVVNWLVGKAGTQTSLFSFPCFYIPAPICCSWFF